VLELYGKRERSNGVMLINLLKCPRCGLENSLGTVRCRGCGFILDRRLADEVRGREEEAKKREEDRKIEELEKRTEELQRQLQQVSSLLVSLLSGRQVSQQQPSPAQQSSPADPQEPFSGQPQPPIWGRLNESGTWRILARQRRAGPSHRHPEPRIPLQPLALSPEVRC
jgi:hypothetical protein